MIAVAIACYNQGHFLRDAIGSVLAQTRPADEILLVDDGSTDDTAAIARAYPQVRYLWQSNAGLSAARNSGLRETRSNHILFLDADDALLPDALERAEARMTSRSDLAFVYGGYREVSADRSVISTHEPRQPEDVFTELFRGNFIAMHGTVLYDVTLLRASGGFDTALRSCEDFDVYLRLARHAPVAPYASIAAEYRRHTNTMTTNALRMIDTSRAVLNRHAQSRAERAMARVGLAHMTDFYADQAIDGWKSALRYWNLTQFMMVLSQLSKHPRASAFVASRVSRRLQARIRRGRTPNEKVSC